MRQNEIFLIDDSPAFGSLAQRYFQGNTNTGSLRYFEKFERAVGQLMVRKPKLIFLDENLGKVKGSEIIPVIREFTNECKIILISANEIYSNSEKMEYCDADSFILKNNSCFSKMKSFMLGLNENIEQNKSRIEKSYFAINGINK